MPEYQLFYFCQPNLIEMTLNLTRNNSMKILIKNKTMQVSYYRICEHRRCYFSFWLYFCAYIGQHRDSNQFNLSGIPGGGHSLHLLRVFCGRADCFEPFACTVHLD